MMSGKDCTPSARGGSRQIRFKQSSKGFSKSEVLVTLIIQTLIKCILAVDREGVERMARLAVRLRNEGVFT